MASELFASLYHKAFRLDCAIIHSLNRLTAGLGAGSTTNRVVLAEQLYNATCDFFDEMDSITRKHSDYVGGTVPYRRSRCRFMCPNCRSSYCGCALPYSPLPLIHVALISPAGGTPTFDDVDGEDEEDFDG